MEKIVILFGAGRNGQSILNENKHRFLGLKILFCDNDIKKQNLMYDGVEIVGFEKVMELYRGGYINKIILTMSNEREILNQCLNAGIDIRDLYFWDKKCNTSRFIGEKNAITIYSQDGEEVFLRELFRKRDHGIYVDIGANHPFRFSNTYWAYLKGWRGINIEPDIINYELLRNIRKDDININCGISDEETWLSYYIFRENALNTFCCNEIENMDDVTDVVKVPVRRLDTILREHNIYEIDFMDIDVEGMELKVLNSIPWDEIKISCILVEQRGMSLYDVLESEICKLLIDKGYIPVSKYNRTVIYMREQMEV